MNQAYHPLKLPLFSSWFAVHVFMSLEKNLGHMLRLVCRKKKNQNIIVCVRCLLKIPFSLVLLERTGILPGMGGDEQELRRCSIVPLAPYHSAVQM